MADGCMRSSPTCPPSGCPPLRCHRLRGGIPQDTIRALKNDFGVIHAPLQSFFGNWLYWQAAAPAHNIGMRLCTLALPRALRRARRERLRPAFFNVPWYVTADACTQLRYQPTASNLVSAASANPTTKNKIITSRMKK
jgi:hypothetical protein